MARRPARLRWRLAAWVATAIALLFGQVLWLPAMGEGQRFCWSGVAVGELLVGLMAALLVTTPPDAIRLRRGVSEGALLAGTAILQVCRPGYVLWYAAAIVAACGLLLWLLRRGGASPWWAATLAWNPAVVLAGALAVRWTG